MYDHSGTRIGRSEKVVRGVARSMRRSQTPAEEALWRALRDRRMDGLKFRRQCPIGRFVVDFCCPSLRLAIELDGSVHDAQVELDRERTTILETGGYRVIRFRNQEVLRNLIEVVRQIRTIARSMQRPNPPLPPAGEGEARSAATSRG